MTSSGKRTKRAPNYLLGQLLYAFVHSILTMSFSFVLIPFVLSAHELITQFIV
jgi:hypothetical protein